MLEPGRGCFFCRDPADDVLASCRFVGLEHSFWDWRRTPAEHGCPGVRHPREYSVMRIALALLAAAILILSAAASRADEGAAPPVEQAGCPNCCTPCTIR